MENIGLQIDKPSIEWAWSRSRDFLKFWK